MDVCFYKFFYLEKWYEGQKFQIKKNWGNLETFIERFTDKVKMQMRWGKKGGEGIKTGDRKGVREGKRKKDRIVEG